MLASFRKRKNCARSISRRLKQITRKSEDIYYHFSKLHFLSTFFQWLLSNSVLCCARIPTFRLSSIVEPLLRVKRYLFWPIATQPVSIQTPSHFPSHKKRCRHFQVRSPVIPFPKKREHCDPHRSVARMVNQLRARGDEEAEIPAWTLCKKKKRSESIRKQVAAHDQEVRCKRVLAEEAALVSLVDGFHTPAPSALGRDNGRDNNAVAAVQSPPTKKRRVWSDGENNDRMQRALAIWRRLKARDASASMRKFAKEWSIPITSFQRSLHADGAISAPGKAPALPAACETRLKEFVLYRVAFGFGVNWVQVRALARKMARQLGIDSFKASNGWLEGFKERHKAEISRHASPVLEFKRKKGVMDATTVDQSVRMLAKAYLHLIAASSPFAFSDPERKQEFINDRIKRWRVWNLGETAFFSNGGANDENGGDVVNTAAANGGDMNSVVAMKKKERHASHDESVVSTVSCVNGQGDSLPLLFILPETSPRADERLPGISDPKAQWWTSPSGRLTEDVWSNNAAPAVLKNLCEYRRHHGDGDDDGVWYLLILDGHGSLSNSYGPLLDFFENRVLVVSMPSHPSANLLPVDVAAFAAVQAEYQALVGETSLDPPIPLWQVPALVDRAWDAVLLDKTKFVNAFQACGILPLNLKWSETHPDSLLLDGTSAMDATTNDDDSGALSSSSCFSSCKPRRKHDVGATKQELVDAKHHDRFDQAVTAFAHAIGLAPEVAARIVSNGMEAAIKYAHHATPFTSSE